MKTTIKFAEYIWLDGSKPTQQLRSKARIVAVPESPWAGDFPTWSFDGSSTGQASGEDSDCLLDPVRVVRDPRREGGFLVLCEVLDADGTPHRTNQRARLRFVLDEAGPDADPWTGFEQEYTIFRNGRPLGFPATGFPAPQGPYYCSVGSNTAYGRDLADAHAEACHDAGLMIYGTNAEVMPGQWEFQVGYRGIEGEPADALAMADHLWLARYLLQREAERFGYDISFANKPVDGDWNGAGMHTNFSTASMRERQGGMQAIREGIQALARRHDHHILHYGEGLAARLTGAHETCNIDTFRSGVAHRGASVRIPQPVARKGCGYFEDRRPGANADPYRVAACLVESVCLEGDLRTRAHPQSAVAAA